MHRELVLISLTIWKLDSIQSLLEELIESFIERLRSNAFGRTYMDHRVNWRAVRKSKLDWYDVAEAVAQAAERDPRLGLSAWAAAYDNSLIGYSSKLTGAICVDGRVQRSA